MRTEEIEQLKCKRSLSRHGAPAACRGARALPLPGRSRVISRASAARLHRIGGRRPFFLAFCAGCGWPFASPRGTAGTASQRGPRRQGTQELERYRKMTKNCAAWGLAAYLQEERGRVGAEERQQAAGSRLVASYALFSWGMFVLLPLAVQDDG